MFSASKTSGPSGYNISNSLRFRASASAYLSRTPASAGNRTTWTWSGWVKRGTIASTSEALFGTDNSNNIRFSNADSSQKLIVENYNGPGADYYIISTAVYRDPSAWYHIVVVWDSGNATASNRQLVYVNGSLLTAITTGNSIPLNATSVINSATAHNIGRTTSGSYYLDGYLAEVNFIDGQALTPSSFGSTNATTGVWQPAKYSGTYGTNGFYLQFSDIATTSGSNAGLGKDFSGNGNYWTTNNISVTSGTTYDAMTDVPTLTSATVANYCVANPIDKGSSLTLSEANLSGSISTTWNIARGTIGASSGKWYYEFQFSGTSALIGICGVVTNLTTNLGVSASDYGYQSSAYKWNNNSQVSYGATWTTGDIIGVAYDLDAGTITFYKNNVSQGVAYSGIPAGTYFPAISAYNSSMWVNFGQRPFSYTPPTGFSRLNTYNLPTSTIVKGNTVMDATTYTGNATNRSITNAGGFKPDLIWFKNRSTGDWHNLYDSNRGATRFLFSNTTDAEGSSGGGLQSFDSNGFSIYGFLSNVNGNGNGIVAWQWQAGQGTNTTNTAGSITSTVSVNATAGFSIVLYTGNATANATIGHGLGVAPKFFVVKTRSSTSEWLAYHVSTGKDGFMQLQSTSAFTSSSNYWGSTGPTSTTIQINGGGGVNNNGSTYVAYCWAEIAGFSRFGSYTGNGSTDGPFVYLGFRPKYVIFKISSASGGDWKIIAASRSAYNVAGNELSANTSAAESTGATDMDMLSNGFKIRATYADTNSNGATYIYAAFAENPFKNALAR